ncbi:hypothetical protein [Viridibacillus arvi]|uniref:hypothetical protein n=1 Tax=Viridibacillus arvi TaxID=263475 RepID=UPI0034CD9E72
MNSYHDVRVMKKKNSSLIRSIANKIYSSVFEVETDTVELKLRMNYVDILRGEELVNDIKDTYMDYYPDVLYLRVEDIIAILYKDFLNQLKSGNQDHKQAVNFLLQGKKEYLNEIERVKIIQQKKELQQISPNTFILDAGIEVEEVDIDDLEPCDIVHLQLEFKIRDINRGKLFLYDVEPFLENVKISIEDVIVIRYLNFIEQIRDSGNNKNVILSILRNLGYKKEAYE